MKVMANIESTVLNDQQPEIIIHYLVLYEKESDSQGHIRKFDAEILCKENFNTSRNNDFRSLKDYSLRNNKTIFVIKVVGEPVVRITPEAKLIYNEG